MKALGFKPLRGKGLIAWIFKHPIDGALILRSGGACKGERHGL